MARNKLDKIIVVDLEATCWEGEIPPGMRSDIIEIGAVSLNVATGEIEQRASYLVRPASSTVSQFCTDLTGYTWNDLKGAQPFDSACKKLIRNFGSKNRVWASWGDYDRLHMERECRYYETPYPFGARHINAKTLFGLVHKLPRELGLKRALQYTGFDFMGTPHKGVDDAYNTARLLHAIMFKAQD